MVGISYPGHHAAVRRADPPAAPRRDHAALGDRRHLRHAVSRAGSSTTASRSGGPRTARPSPTLDQLGRRPGVGEQAHRRRRQDVPRQPGAPAPGSRRAPRDPGQRATAAARQPTRSRRRRSSHKIDVPVFLAGSWQDEETGSHFANMLGDFSPGIPVKVTLMNGVHQDSLGPRCSRSGSSSSTSTSRNGSRRSHRPPARSPRSACSRSASGPGVSLPPDRFTTEPDYASALRAYEAEPPVRVLFDVGAGTRRRCPRSRRPRRRCPLPGTTARPPGTSAPTARSPTRRPAVGGRRTASRTTRRHSRAPTKTIDDGAHRPTYDWKPVPTGKAVAYVTAPLTADTVMLGTGSVDLWVRSTTRPTSTSR